MKTDTCARCGQPGGTFIECQFRKQLVHDTHADCVERLQAEIDRLTLTYSDDKPDIPGVYWHRGPRIEGVVNVVGAPHGLFVTEVEEYVRFMNGQWAGPFPKPQEQP